jgi:hypothetical protein
VYVGVEDVVTLVPNEIVEKQVQMGEDIGETSIINIDRIEVDLEKTILMIEEQENVILTPMSEQENANEVVEPHANIDGGDILNIIYYNLLPHPSFQVEKMGGVFFVNFVIIIPSLIVVFKPLLHLPSLCEKVGGEFFLLKVSKQYLKAL